MTVKIATKNSKEFSIMDANLNYLAYILAGGVGFVALGFWAAWAAQD
jgi:hypothetical protein